MNRKARFYSSDNAHYIRITLKQLISDVQFRIQGRLIDEKFFVKKIAQITGNVSFLIRLVYQTRTRRRMYEVGYNQFLSVDRTGATWPIDQSGSLICRSPPSEIFPRNRAGSPVQTSRRKRTRHTRWRVHFAACNCTAITATRSSVWLAVSLSHTLARNRSNRHVPAKLARVRFSFTTSISGAIDFPPLSFFLFVVALSAIMDRRDVVDWNSRHSRS